MSENEIVESQLSNIILKQLKLLIENYAGREEELALETVELVASDVLFKQGEVADCMFWLLSGKLEASTQYSDGSQQVVTVLTDGSHVGEMGLLTGLQRTATIRALEESKLLRVTIDDVFKLSKLDAKLLGGLNNVAASRWQSLFLSNSLKTLLGDLSFDVLQELQEEFEWMELHNGDILFHEGDEADGVYLIISGRLCAKVATDDGSDKVVGELGPSDFVGEYALLTDDPRSATVYATRNTSIVKMSLKLLDKHIITNPTLMRHIARTVILRQKEMMRAGPAVKNKHLSVTVIPHDSITDVRAFTDELAMLLKQYGDTLVIDSEDFDEYFGQQGVAESPMNTPIQPVISSHLNELEGRYRYVFFIAGDAQSNWTKRATGQSDRLLVIAQADADPGVSEVEKISDKQAIPLRMDLVLLHAEGTNEPKATSTWLSQRKLTTHYHVRRGDPVHMARLARRLTGHAIGMVCSGGGARGYAQMGVYKAMSDLDIPIDYIAGTSMGAIISSAIACGFSYEACEELATWTTKLGVTDFTLPLASVAASANVTRICKHSYGERMIEDLWVPYFCISSNLTKAERVVHQTGLLWRAVRSSMAIPGVFLPIVEKGDVLVDGGVMDNYPVKLMSQLAETKRLIGVNVNPYIERSVSFDYDTSLSGWRILLNRLNPFSKRLRAPSVMGTILRSMFVNSMKKTKITESYLELNIKPDIRKFTMNDYSKWREIARTGFDASYEELNKWKSEQADLNFKK